jgi:hypothetical protein
MVGKIWLLGWILGMKCRTRVDKIAYFFAFN